MNRKKVFDQLYDAYWLEMRKFIFVEARRDPEYTNEIFQNTWENVWRYLHTLKEFKAARAWLYSIARNEAKRYFADNNIRMFTNMISLDTALYGSVQNEEPAAFAADEPEDFDEGLFPQKLADEQFLVSLLNRLTKEEQQLILLHYAYDIKLKDIAALYNANYNTLKSITRRAVGKLREMAEGE